MLDLRGELAALVAAFFWALATVMFGRLGKQLAPLMLNLVKGVLAVSLIGVTVGAQTFYQPQVPWQLSSGLDQTSVLLLLGSGGIGIGLGDTAYFTALNYLGARRVLLLEALAPAMAALMALGVLQEYLVLRDWLGIVLTLLGVSWVIAERVPSPAGELHHPWLGVIYGCLAAGGQALGAVMSRAALADTTVDPLGSTLLRLVGGLSIMGVLLLRRGQWRQQLRPLVSARLLGLLVAAAFLGTYLALWLQQAALKYAPTGIAQALLSTSPLFILPIVGLMGERISLRAMLGVLVALAGVWLLVGLG